MRVAILGMGAIGHVMGAYLPTVKYTDRAHFERNGCSSSTR